MRYTRDSRFSDLEDANAQSLADGLLDCLRGEATVFDRLCEIARDHQHRAEYKATKALGHLPPDRAIPVLIELVDDRMTFAAIDTLGKFNDPLTIESLVRVLKEYSRQRSFPNRLVQVTIKNSYDAAVDGLRNIGTPEALAAIARYPWSASESFFWRRLLGRT